MNLIVTVIVVAALLYILKSITNIIFRERPGPTPWPLIGNIPALVKFGDDVLDGLISFHKKYGDVFDITFGPFAPRQVFLINPQDVKHVLNTNFDNYERATEIDRFNVLFGKGIFTSNGGIWRIHRKTARPMFSKNTLASFLPKFVEKSELVLTKLDKALNARTAIDVQDLFFRFTLDAMGEVGFGHSINSLDKDVPFAEAFNRSQYCIELDARNPIRVLLPNKEFDADVKLMRDYIFAIVKERQRVGDWAERKDLLSRFMALTNEETGEPFSDEYLVDVVMNFAIAGRDTTACLLTWTCYMLSQNPEVEKKLVAEIDEIFQGQPPVSDQHLKQATYLQNVLDETLRLYPSVPIDVRRSRESDVLPSGVSIPKGVDVCYSGYIMARSEKIWKDAERFNPDRFDSKDWPRDAFVSFHAGPQTCLGRPFAYMEAKTMIVLLLQKYHLTLAPNQIVAPKPAIVLPARHGVKMLVTKREK